MFIKIRYFVLFYLSHINLNVSKLAKSTHRWAPMEYGACARVASEPVHVQIKHFKGFFTIKHMPRFALTHFKLDYNLLTYICFAFCAIEVADIESIRAYFYTIKKKGIIQSYGCVLLSTLMYCFRFLMAFWWLFSLWDCLGKRLLKPVFESWNLDHGGMTYR